MAITFHHKLPPVVEAGYQANLTALSANRVLDRLWAHDHTLWNESPDEIANRMDWLELPDSMATDLTEINSFTTDVRKTGFEKIVLLGMGGSSLAPEVFVGLYGRDRRFPSLFVLDTTDPDAIVEAERGFDLQHTLFLVSSKSGGTVETLSLFKYFYNRVSKEYGADKAGRHFVAITDPGSRLERMAEDLNFRKCFLNNPNLGGRYSALSHFGLVAAGLIGADVNGMLASARMASAKNSSEINTKDALGPRLGAVLAACYSAGRDKLTLFADTALGSISDWIEQLIAESSGKAGRGILPVIEPGIASDLSQYSKDRLFVFMQEGSVSDFEERIETLAQSSHPVLNISLEDRFNLPGLMFDWEIATAIAGHLIGFHPFNQPNVESAKVGARTAIQEYELTGSLKTSDHLPADATQIKDFIQQGKQGDYIALQAFLPASPDHVTAFERLQTSLRDHTGLPVTLGFGPRFLHSTGQLHKGDRGNGLFIQFVTSAQNDLVIPDEAGKSGSSISFETLKQAQAAGDATALREAGRRVLALSISQPITAAIDELTKGIDHD